MRKDKISAALAKDATADDIAVGLRQLADDAPGDQVFNDDRRLLRLAARRLVFLNDSLSRIRSETRDSLMMAINADRAAIADWIVSCREGGNMKNVVQVFDVLAKQIRSGEHLPPLPSQERGHGA